MHAEKGKCDFFEDSLEYLGHIIDARKFHQYLYGRKFTFFTDHRPLTTVFGPQKEILSMAAAPMQRWALLAVVHNYTIVYKRAKHHTNAGGLYRLPLQVKHREKNGFISDRWRNSLSVPLIYDVRL